MDVRHVHKEMSNRGRENEPCIIPVLSDDGSADLQVPGKIIDDVPSIFHTDDISCPGIDDRLLNGQIIPSPCLIHHDLLASRLI